MLAGPVSNLPHWPLWLGLSGVLFAAGLLLGGRPANRRAALLQPFAAALGALCIGLWGEQALVSSRDTWEYLWAAGLIGLNLIVLAHACLALTERRGLRERLFAWLEARSGWWLAVTGFAGAVMALELVFDARYRSFPSAALLFPALVYLCRPAAGPRRETLLLTAMIGAGIAPQLVQEGLGNIQALGWAGVSLLLTAALWRGLHGQRAATAKSSVESGQPHTV
ncbi:hypothetical protein D3C78_726710 [compost metagenome]